MLVPRLLLALWCCSARGGAWEFSNSHYEQSLVSALASTCLDIGCTYGAAACEVDDCTTGTILVGSGGSSSSCARTYNMPVWLVAIDSTFEWVEDLAFTVDVLLTSKLSGMTLDLYGLGLRNASVLTAADHSWAGADIMII